MSLHAQPLEPIPELTSRIAKASFPKGTLAMHLRDALGSIYEDADFAELFPKRGRAADAHAPQSVRACSSLAHLQQMWTQHFEWVDGQVRWRDGPVVESAERVISPYETDARASRKRDTEWVGYKVHLTETCGEDEAVQLIVQAEITPATEQDVEETMPRLA